MYFTWPVRHQGGLICYEEPAHADERPRIGLHDFFRIFLVRSIHEPAPLHFARPAHACGLAGELGKMAELNL